ncbi:hypothetical protein DPMN_123194 [Dreissena polymorpha]|uniref:Uncharacterized protein n=1 Tax=Dreissena polymorpha TaxID=45954 RepID=A0A9D4GTV0_DREPO|nr:hypothetical protein DPMN_123194 [Dreissena polymorpha]
MPDHHKIKLMSDCYMQIVHVMKTDETPTSCAPTPLTPTHEIIQGMPPPTTRITRCRRLHGPGVDEFISKA